MAAQTRVAHTRRQLFRKASLVVLQDWSAARREQPAACVLSAELQQRPPGTQLMRACIGKQGICAWGASHLKPKRGHRGT